MSIVTSYFQNGQLVKILPADNCNQYTSRYIISDGQRFDLELASDIANIPIPIFNSTNHLPNISKSLDYVIYRKAGDLELKGLFDLSIICLRKANELMSHSPIHWNKSNYFYIVLELTRAERFEEAKREKEFIETHYHDNYSFETLHARSLKKALRDASVLKTDLVESDAAPNCNAVCAKYRKRIYSLTGKDSRFPQITPEIYNCGLIFYPFIYGVSAPRYCSKEDIFAYNNRPFIEDRTEEEKRNYILYNAKAILEDRKATDFLEYKQICFYLPNLKPKSFAAYQKMKLKNTEQFQELMQVAEENRIDIELLKLPTPMWCVEP